MNRAIIESRTRLITHANCPDGIASAMIIAAALPGIEVVFCDYNTEQHRSLIPGAGDLFCDFTPHRTTVDAFVSAGAVVLDHHAGQRDIVERFGERGVYADEPGVSGASLAWSDAWSPLWGNASYSQLHEFAMLAGIRDTWQRSHPRWDDACAQAAALVFYGPEWLIGGAPWLTAEQLRVGAITHERRLAAARSAASRSFPFGNAVLLNDTERLVSDVADYLRRVSSAYGILAAFNYDVNAAGDVVIRFSVRSIDPRIDVLPIALANGGGGHARAAGFSVRPFDMRHGYDAPDPISAWTHAVGRAADAGLLSVVPSSVGPRRRLEET